MSDKLTAIAKDNMIRVSPLKLSYVVNSIVNSISSFFISPPEENL